MFIKEKNYNIFYIVYSGAVQATASPWDFSYYKFTNFPIFNSINLPQPKNYTTLSNNAISLESCPIEKRNQVDVPPPFGLEIAIKKLDSPPFGPGLEKII